MDGTTWQGNQTPVPALLQLSRPANPRACGLGLCAACVVPRGLPRSERQTALHTDTEGGTSRPVSREVRCEGCTMTERRLRWELGKGQQALCS